MQVRLVLRAKWTFQFFKLFSSRFFLLIFASMLCSDVLLFAFLVLLYFLDGLGTNGPLSCSSIVAFDQVS